MEISIDGYCFEIDHFTVYDNTSTVTVSFEYTPIGYMDRMIESVSGHTIRDEHELEAFAREWLENNKNLV